MDDEIQRLAAGLVERRRGWVMEPDPCQQDVGICQRDGCGLLAIPAHGGICPTHRDEEWGTEDQRAKVLAILRPMVNADITLAWHEPTHRLRAERKGWCLDVHLVVPSVLPAMLAVVAEEFNEGLADLDFSA